LGKDLKACTCELHYCSSRLPDGFSKKETGGFQNRGLQPSVIGIIKIAVETRLHHLCWRINQSVSRINPSVHLLASAVQGRPSALTVLPAVGRTLTARQQRH